MTPFLPYGRQQIDEADLAAVCEVLLSDWLTTGPAVARFETALAERVGARHVVACSNGTAALHLALIGLNVAPGSWVAVPANTFLATANAVRYVGGEVLFVDVDPDSGLMTPETLLAALERCGEPVAGAIPVHFAGQCVDLPGVSAIARERGMFVVADAAHAIGARYRDETGAFLPVGGGRHAQATTFSFHPVKTVTMGEGGAIATDDDDVCGRMRAARSHGMIAAAERIETIEEGLDAAGGLNPWYYEMLEIGFNYRVTDMQCALGLSQLNKLDRFIARRAELVRHYDSRFEGFAPLLAPLRRTPDSVPAWHLYPALIDFDEVGVERATVMRRLHEAGIGTQVHYRPVSRQPYYAKRYGPTATRGADAFYRRTLSLPLFPAMEIADADRVADALLAVLGVRSQPAQAQRLGMAGAR